MKNLPAELVSLPQWGLWRAVEKNGRITKIPYSARTGKAARTNVAADWTDYKTAQRALGNGGGYSGLGFRFDSANGIVGLDLDNALTETGVVKPWAKAIIDEAASYTEISPSGRGLHVFVKGTKPTAQCRAGVGDGHLEIYGARQYFTVTGNAIEARPVEARQAALDKICSRYLNEAKASGSAPDLAGLSFEDAALLNQARAAKNGAKFQRLWAGDVTGYPSQSEADAALAAILLFWVKGDVAKADALFRQSGLMRDKWDRNAGGGKAYGERTLETALAAAGKRQADETADAQEVKAKVAAGLKAAVKPLRDFALSAPPPREIYLSPWLTAQSISMIWGERGIGKSWFTIGALEALTTGKPFGPWPCLKPVSCLYLDGEMCHQDVVERFSGLLQAEAKAELHILSCDFAARMGLPAFDLDDPVCRDAMTEVLKTLGVKVFVVDNISSLTGGDENDKAAWSPINRWAIGLRSAGISVLFIHHANKSGAQRGTSAREDNIDVSLNLFRPKDYSPGQGARFGVRFTKARIPHRHLSLIAETEFQLEPDETGRLVWTHNQPQKEIRGEALALLGQGRKQIEVAGALGVTRGWISKVRQEAIKAGLLNEDNTLTDKGRAEVDWK